MKVEIEVSQDGSWILRLHGVGDREALASAQCATAEALGELAWEALNKAHMTVIEKLPDGSVAKSIDERAYQEAVVRRAALGKARS